MHSKKKEISISNDIIFEEKKHFLQFYLKKPIYCPYHTKSKPSNSTIITHCCNMMICSNDALLCQECFSDPGCPGYNHLLHVPPFIQEIDEFLNQIYIETRNFKHSMKNNHRSSKELASIEELDKKETKIMYTQTNEVFSNLKDILDEGLHDITNILGKEYPKIEKVKNNNTKKLKILKEIQITENNNNKIDLLVKLKEILALEKNNDIKNQTNQMFIKIYQEIIQKFEKEIRLILNDKLLQLNKELVAKIKQNKQNEIENSKLGNQEEIINKKTKKKRKIKPLNKTNSFIEEDNHIPAKIENLITPAKSPKDEIKQEFLNIKEENDISNEPKKSNDKIQLSQNKKRKSNEMTNFKNGHELDNSKNLKDKKIKVNQDELKMIISTNGKSMTCNSTTTFVLDTISSIYFHPNTAKKYINICIADQNSPTLISEISSTLFIGHEYGLDLYRVNYIYSTITAFEENIIKFDAPLQKMFTFKSVNGTRMVTTHDSKILNLWYVDPITQRTGLICSQNLKHKINCLKILFDRYILLGDSFGQFIVYDTSLDKLNMIHAHEVRTDSPSNVNSEKAGIICMELIKTDVFDLIENPSKLRTIEDKSVIRLITVNQENTIFISSMMMRKKNDIYEFDSFDGSSLFSMSLKTEKEQIVIAKSSLNFPNVIFLGWGNKIAPFLILKNDLCKGKIHHIFDRKQSGGNEDGIKDLLVFDLKDHAYFLIFNNHLKSAELRKVEKDKFDSPNLYFDSMINNIEILFDNLEPKLQLQKDANQKNALSLLALIQNEKIEQYKIKLLQKNMY